MWLYGCAGMVFGIVFVGGTTRLTESGLSMVEWKPHQILPPMNQAEWEEEFGKYKQFPEYEQLNRHMTLEEFKKIFFWEYFHRLLGRGVGVLFTVPMIYFGARGMIPRHLWPKLGAMLLMGGSQGALGWYMVKSGLDQKDFVTPYPTVSPYRLAAHLTSAFIIFSFITWTALSLSYPSRLAQLTPEIARFRKFVTGVTGLVATTVVSGAFVAGLDAGLIYNEFPFMGLSIIPKEWGDLSPVWRNFTENPAAVQFNHRLLGCTTYVFICSLYYLSRRIRVPPVVANLSLLSLGVATLQVILGISTLLTHVPVSLGVMHQTGSLSLLTVMIGLLHTLRRIRF